MEVLFDFIGDIFTSGAFFIAYMMSGISSNLWKIQNSQLNSELYKKMNKKARFIQFVIWLIGLTLMIRFLAGS